MIFRVITALMLTYALGGSAMAAKSDSGKKVICKNGVVSKSDQRAGFVSWGGKQTSVMTSSLPMERLIYICSRNDSKKASVQGKYNIKLNPNTCQYVFMEPIRKGAFYTITIDADRRDRGCFKVVS